MNSQKNVLQVLVSEGFNSHAAGAGAATVDGLPIGELAFYDKANARATTGAGRFVYRADADNVIESNYISNFIGWSLVSYAAPLLHAETITIANAIANAYYQLQVTMDIKGMTGKYIKHAAYKAKVGDTATDIATALAASLNAGLKREGNTALTVTSSTDTITVEGRLQTYDAGKKSGNQVPFHIALTAPEDDAELGTITVVGTNGKGTGNYIHEKEFFAWGNQDSFRYNSWRNNFTPKTFSSPSSTYDTQVLNEDEYKKTANADVRTSLQIIIAFNSAGSAPAA